MNSQASLIDNNCVKCSKPATFVCSGCEQFVKYCSQECQTEDWPRHSAKCGGGGATMNPRGGSTSAAGRPESIKTTHTASASLRKRKSMGRTTSAQLINAGDLDAVSEYDLGEDLRFYVQQIYLIVKPVLACILLSIFWVKVANSGNSDYRPAGSAAQVYVDDPNDSTSMKFLGSLKNALIIIAQIVVMTILIGFLVVVVAVLLGFMGYLLELNLLSVFNIPMDYITLIFGLWNFAFVGLIMVFWGKGPIRVQQVYLTVMSSLMAFSLTGLAEWTTWILLALLAVWDLIAVLCPFGPLKVLIESSKKQGQEVPALLYSVNAVWFMAFETTQLSRSAAGASPGGGGGAATVVAEQSPAEASRRLNPTTRQYLRNSEDGAVEMVDVSPNRQVHDPSTTASLLLGDDFDEEEEQSGLKLGLGDFVFYSVLIARAALFDWVTTIACTVAVMMGLNGTIFLLAIKRKALPALPISIAFGITFYLIGRIMLTPCLEVLSFAQVQI